MWKTKTKNLREFNLKFQEHLNLKKSVLKAGQEKKLNLREECSK